MGPGRGPRPRERRRPPGPPGQNFFLDFAAYFQFLAGFPLFVFAEGIVSGRTREAARLFVSTGVIAPADAPRLDLVHRDIERLRRSAIPDLVCIAVAYTLSVATIHPQLSGAGATWHTVTGAAGKTLSPPGWWEMLVALPVLDYWWLRWIWKIGLWCAYLFRLSRFRLTLMATHPDGTGGLAFLSEAQTKFGLTIPAYGVSNVASTVGYKLLVEHASPGQPPVWGPLVGFVIGAPLLFTVPLFLFTRQLRHAKQRALELYGVRAMSQALALEAQWRAREAPAGAAAPADIGALNQLRALYQHVQAMRVVPFDLRSFSELVGYATGPFLPLLTLIEKLDSPAIRWLIGKASGG